MPLVAKSDQSTGNSAFASYVLKSNELTFIFTAPYSRKLTLTEGDLAVPSYNHDSIYHFINSHGLAVRAVGRLGTAPCQCVVSLTARQYLGHASDSMVSPLQCSGIVVEDARAAFKTAVANGGTSVHHPTALKDAEGRETVMAEVAMYGDVVMRFMSGNLQVSWHLSSCKADICLAALARSSHHAGSSCDIYT